MIISLGLGIVSGLFSLFVLRVGVFLAGSCLGIVVATGIHSISSKRGHIIYFMQHFFFSPSPHPLQVASGGASISITTLLIVYAVSGVAGGFLALYKEKVVIISVTALGGAFVVFIGESQVSAMLHSHKPLNLTRSPPRRCPFQRMPLHGRGGRRSWRCQRRGLVRWRSECTSDEMRCVGNLKLNQKKKYIGYRSTKTRCVCTLCVYVCVYSILSCVCVEV